MKPRNLGDQIIHAVDFKDRRAPLLEIGARIGAFLRAALPTELDYSAHETYSASMADIILRVVQGYGFERGDAAMEFITSLAIGKIRLHKEVDEKLRANIKLALENKVGEIGLLLGEEAAPF